MDNNISEMFKCNSNKEFKEFSYISFNWAIVSD